MADPWLRPEILMLWLVVAVVTYLTRIGGHLILSRFSRIHPRVEAALEAVPAAVITSIVIPPALSGGIAEIAAILVAGFAALRFAPVIVMATGLLVLVTARMVGL